MKRQLATVRKIKDIHPIQGADKIELAVVDGWQVVVSKGQFKPGDNCLYLEIDSWVPTELAAFLTKEGKEPKVFKGIKGERLRTIKLKGQLSQGLILPLAVLPLKHYLSAYNGEPNSELDSILNVTLYELESDSNLPVTNKLFPVHLFPKTDQDRIQNCFERLRFSQRSYEVTLKLDGSSCTIFKYNGELRVCSRNLELQIYKPISWFGRLKKSLGLRVTRAISDPDNPFIKMALKVEDNLKNVDQFAFQGELMGPKIQGNREGFEGYRWFVYDIIELGKRKKLFPARRQSLCRVLGLEHVPVLKADAPIPVSVAEALAEADQARSMNHPIAEGFVYKDLNNTDISFKVISNRYLLNE